MMTLKNWNTLAESTRKEIINLCGFNASEALLRPYHHNFNFDATGKKLRKILEMCYLRPTDNKIVVSIEVSPRYATKSEAQINTPSDHSERKRYKFRRYTYDDPDDGEWVWCWAESEQEAREYLEGEYWNTKELDFYGTF